jgi:UPF0755 protein
MDNPQPGRDSQTPCHPPFLRWLTVRLIGAAVAGVLLSGIAAGFFGLLAYQHVMQPGVAGENIRVTVPEGATGREVGRILEQNGLVEHELLFRLALRLDKTPQSIKQGRYTLPRGLSALELLEMLQKGAPNVFDPLEIPDELKVTVPEGLTIEQASQLFDEPREFVAAASDPQVLARVGVTAPSLEGFLLPNTYYFDKKPAEREVVERMADQFKKEFDGLVSELALPEGYTALQVVTVASLVEEEARAAEERPDIAAVIYNRLDRGMPLQLDSTLQYALKKYGQRLLYSDREVDSPYNTYKNKGLPPGPISNPGAASLRAALQPSAADYVYFVSNADGRTHTFSSSDAEHVRAVQRFRREIAPQRKAEREKEGAE